ncbi:DUF1737 domain-containing protein, partial [Nostoc linckia]
MKEYKVIHLVDILIFERTVAKYISQGWELVGGVSVFHHRGYMHYHQAIT